MRVPSVLGFCIDFGQGVARGGLKVLNVLVGLHEELIDRRSCGLGALIAWPGEVQLALL